MCVYVWGVGGCMCVWGGGGGGGVYMCVCVGGGVYVCVGE